MHPATIAAFVHELEKIALVLKGPLVPARETLAALGGLIPHTSTTVQQAVNLTKLKARMPPELAKSWATNASGKKFAPYKADFNQFNEHVAPANNPLAAPAIPTSSVRPPPASSGGFLGRMHSGASGMWGRAKGVFGGGQIQPALG